MLKDIPYSFKDINEDYLIVQKLQEFCKNNNLPVYIDKLEQIKSIINFANLNKNNETKVLKLLDESLKEGTKKLMIARLCNTRKYMNKSKTEWENLIKNSFKVNNSNYIVTATDISSTNFKLCGYKFNEVNGVVDIISLNFVILLKEHKNRELPFKTIIYPIFIDIYINKGYMVGRAKSKSSLFQFKDEEQNDEDYRKVNSDNLVLWVFKLIYSKLVIEQESKDSSIHKFKTLIHDIIAECTKTPQQIEDELNEEEDYKKDFVKNFFNRKSINLFAKDNYENALKDIKIFMEKYLSINYKNRDIFTENRYAYPVQIAVTDEDFASIDESSIEKVPLQCTSIFFDNKKLIQKQKKCDNVILIFKRNPKMYFTNKSFQVILGVKKGYMYIDFRKYALEEDIRNVLSRIIRYN